jgi:hypothetical protein
MGDKQSQPVSHIGVTEKRGYRHMADNEKDLAEDLDLTKSDTDDVVGGTERTERTERTEGHTHKHSHKGPR